MSVSDQASNSPFPFIPRLALWGEEVLVPDAERPCRAGLARLTFDYEGQLCLPLRQEQQVAETQPQRHLSDERRAERILESLGACDLSQLDGVLPDYHSTANYFIALESDVHVGASFSAHAIRELCRLGFVVEVLPGYPFLVAPSESPLLASLETDDKLDWFDIELGVEINGESYTLVPGLLELLRAAGDPLDFRRLAQAPGKFRAVALGDGRYAALPWERLKQMLIVLSEVCNNYDTRAARLRLPIPRMLDLCKIDDAFSTTEQKLKWSSDTDWLARARALAAGPLHTPAPAALRATLRPYQTEGLRWLEHKRDAGVGAILADDMGLGKTLQTIALLAREKDCRRMDLPSLIVAPKSLLSNWERELQKFAPQIRCLVYAGTKRHNMLAEFHRVEVIITSYPVLIRDLQPLTDREFHYVVIDEAQTIKNPQSQASTAVRSLSARHRLALSGTPVENHLSELWALFEFTHPGLLGRYHEYRKHFRDPIERMGDEGRLMALRERIAPFILRRVKESVAQDLPPKTELIRAVELNGAQRDLYESIRLSGDRAVRQAIAQGGLNASRVTILSALLKLRQVCADPRLIRLNAPASTVSSAKYDLFFELVEAQLHGGRRILVFSQFAQMLALLSKGLEERGIKHLVLTGGSPHRQQLVDRFESGKADVFLISLKAGGTGLNLVSADTVIHYDPWWNSAAQAQATDRAYRIGQKRPVFVYNLIVASSVEDRMLTLQERKQRLASQVLGQAPAGTTLSLHDLDELLAPLESPG